MRKMPSPYLRPPTDPRDAKARADLIAQASHNLAEIDQIFLDVAHWNAHVRQAHEPPIDPDPDGQLEQFRVYYRTLIAQAVY